MYIDIIYGTAHGPRLAKTIGEPVDIPGMPAGSCAVHGALHGKGFTVSHIESGHQIAWGPTIVQAIESAKGRVEVAALSPDEMAAGIREAVRIRQEAERQMD